jgi:hypothetical protein
MLHFKEGKMKHVILPESGSAYWKFEETPFAAFRCYLGGSLKIVVPVKGVHPVTTVRVVGYPYDDKGFIKAWYPEVLYQGTDMQKATYVANRCSNIVLKNGGTETAQIQVVKSLLPANKFRVVSTPKAKVLVVPGEDDSERAFAFVGCSSGFRGDVRVEEATCNVLLSAGVRFRLWGGVEVVAIFEPGQSLVFHRTGRREDEYVRYTWDGAEMRKDVYPRELWLAASEAASVGSGEVEVL